MFRALSIMILGTLLLSALLTPPVYSLLLSVYPDMPWPYSRVFDRVAMVCLLVFVILFRKEFELSSVKAFLKPEGASKSHLLRLVIGGALLSFLTAALIFPFVLQMGPLVWKERSVDYLFWKFAKAVPAGILIALIEESFFRVLLFKRLKKAFPLIAAASMVSLFYAVVHFISPAKSFQYEGYSLEIGFTYLGLVIERMMHVELLAALLGLFLVGMVLCYTIEKTKSIYLCIGLHAGWIIAVKMTQYATAKAPGYEFAASIGRRYFLVSTPLGWLSILLVGAVVFLWHKRVRASTPLTAA